MSVCPHTILSVCFSRAPTDAGYAIFGFSEFLTALALLVLVFSSSDFIYQFRISVAPLPLRWLSFGAAAGIGLGTLLTDMWFAEHWYAPAWGVSRATIEGILGSIFLLTVLLWIWFAWMKPPVFSRWNYERFYGALFRTVVRGSDAQLAALAGELLYSAEPIVRYSSPRISGRKLKPPTERQQRVARFANDAMLLLGNRKLCRHVIASSPVTAILFMDEAAKQERYSVPLGGFARNITEEALRNRDSILFHEDRLGSDVLAMVQPFSQAMYGNYKLVEGVGRPFDGPLDVDWKFAWDMDGPQFEAYSRITLLTFTNYIETGAYRRHSPALFRALEVIEGAGREVYKLDNQPFDATDSTAVKRLSAAVHFVQDVIRLLSKQPDLDFGRLRRRNNDYVGQNIFDRIADLMFELIFQASSVRAPIDTAWTVQYNIVWGRIFTFHEPSRAWDVLRFKLNRLLFDEIKRLEQFPNFKGSRILGFCLNVLGLDLPVRGDGRWRNPELTTAVLRWTKRNYTTLREMHPPVAESVLIGGISFDEEHERLVKTYSQGLSLRPSRRFLDLDPPDLRRIAEYERSAGTE